MERTPQSKIDAPFKIYSITILGDVFKYRALSRLELNKIRERYRDKPAQLEEEMCRVATIEPVEFDFENCRAGIPSTLAEEIVKKSGFFDTEYAKGLFEKYQDEMMEQENRLDAMILCALPSTSLDNIQSWPPEKYLKMLALSEFILVNIMEMPSEKVQRLSLPRDELEKELKNQKLQPDIPADDIRARSRGIR